MADPDNEQVMGYIYTHWDCPECGTVNEAEGDAAMEDVQCFDCGTMVNILEVK